MLDAIALFLVAAHAGRPVFHDLSLSDLGARSEAIVVAKRTAVREGGWGGFPPCRPTRWTLAVERALRGKFAKGDRITVIPNEVSVTDCLFRREHSSGVSFSAERYAGRCELLEAEKPAVLFLKKYKGEWALTVENACASPEDPEIAARFAAP